MDSRTRMSTCSSINPSMMSRVPRWTPRSRATNRGSLRDPPNPAQTVSVLLCSSSTSCSSNLATRRLWRSSHSTSKTSRSSTKWVSPATPSYLAKSCSLHPRSPSSRWRSLCSPTSRPLWISRSHYNLSGFAFRGTCWSHCSCSRITVVSWIVLW